MTKEDLIKDCAMHLFVYGICNNKLNASDEQIANYAIKKAKIFADIYEETNQ
jgi:hypothetical protein